MKILFIGALPEPITGQSLACQVCLEDLRRDHDVDVINLSKATFAQGVDSARRVREVLGIIWRAARKARRADVVYLTVSESRAGNLKDVALYLVCRSRLRRMVIHLHGGAGLRHIMLGGGWPRRLNDRFVRRVGGAIVLGQRHVEVFSEALPADRIHIVPNFAEDYLFASDEEIGAKFDAPGPLRALFLSNLLPGKGYLELLDAVEQLEPNVRDDLVIDIAGGFEGEADRAQFLGRIAAIPQIRYHGVARGEAKKELFHGAHVFCLPTYYPYEGQPISILEAYASGCAVITTDHSGIPDVFVPEVNGFQVAARSAESLREQLTRSARSRELLREIALTNARYARERFRVGTYTANLRAVIERVGRGRSHAALTGGASRGAGDRETVGRGSPGKVRA